MKGSCGQLFSRPGFTGNQHGSEMLRDTPYPAERLEHGGTASDHRRKLVFVEKSILEFETVLSVAEFREERLDPFLELLCLDRLVQVVASAFLDRFDGRFGAVVSREEVSSIAGSKSMIFRRISMPLMPGITKSMMTN